MIEAKLIEGYIEHCERERRLDGKTLRAYRVDLEQFGEWASGVEELSLHVQNAESFRLLLISMIIRRQRHRDSYDRMPMPN